MTATPLLAATLFLFGAGAAMAQEAPGAAPPPPAPPGVMPPMPHPPMGPAMMHMGGMAMLQKAAAFRFKRGDAEIEIKCAADESTKACVDAASTLIDKVREGAPH